MSGREYADFDLAIEQRADGGYRVRVLDSPAGEARVDIAFPFSPLELENFVLKMGGPRRGVRRLESPQAEMARQFGEKLFESILTGDVRTCWMQSVSSTQDEGRGLRLRLRLGDAPELAVVPWEFLHSTTLDRPLVLSTWTPVVRYLEMTSPVVPLTIAPPLRILAMVSSPSDYPSLDVAAEWAKVEESLQPLIDNGQIELERTDVATLRELQRAIRRTDIHVFHFIGHGGYDDLADDGALMFETEDGQSRKVSGRDLGMILSDPRTVRLAVLNACEGARSSIDDPFAGVAPSLVRAGIPAVVAMQFEFSDRAAVVLAHEFYAAIADGYPVDAALAEARRGIYGSGGSVEWATPVLHMRSDDGRLFEIDAAAAPTASMSPVVVADAEPVADSAAVAEDLKPAADSAVVAEELEPAGDSDVVPDGPEAVGDPPVLAEGTDPTGDVPVVVEEAEPILPGGIAPNQDPVAAEESPVREMPVEDRPPELGAHEGATAVFAEPPVDRPLESVPTVAHDGAGDVGAASGSATVGRRSGPSRGAKILAGLGVAAMVAAGGFLLMDNSEDPPIVPPEVGDLEVVSASTVAAVPAPDGIRVDGDVSEWAAVTTAFRIDQPIFDDVQATSRLGTDATGHVRLAFDNDRLYLLFVVEDDVYSQKNNGNVIFRGDAVTLNIRAGDPDSAASRPGPEDFQVTVTPRDLDGSTASVVFVGNPDPDRGFGADSTTEDIDIAGVIDADGSYVVETSLPWSVIGLPGPPTNDVLALLAIFDNDGEVRANGDNSQRRIMANVGPPDGSDIGANPVFQTPPAWGRITFTN